VFGIGGNELLIIGVFALIIFGPDKIPEIARTAGKAIQMFKKAQADVEHVIKTEIYDPAADLLDPLGLKSSSSTQAPAPAAAPTQTAEQAAGASAIWAAAVDNEDEEGEEE
jgi:sec-independent protein translocase protein TatB/colicin import membrane protein